MKRRLQNRESVLHVTFFYATIKMRRRLESKAPHSDIDFKTVTHKGGGLFYCRRADDEEN